MPSRRRLLTVTAVRPVGGPPGPLGGFPLVRAGQRQGQDPSSHLEAAVAARQAILAGPADEAAAGAWTVARWLRYWLKLAEPHLRPSTLHGYRDHIDRYLIPSIGRITLADLTGKRLQACFDLLARQRTRNGTLIASSTVDRVRNAPGARLGGTTVPHVPLAAAASGYCQM